MKTLKILIEEVFMRIGCDNEVRNEVSLGAGLLAIGAVGGAVLGWAVSVGSLDYGYDKIAQFFNCCYYYASDTCQDALKYPVSVWCDGGVFEGARVGLLFECVKKLSPEDLAALCKQGTEYSNAQMIGYGAAIGAGLVLLGLGGSKVVSLIKNRANASSAENPATESTRLIQNV